MPGYDEFVDPNSAIARILQMMQGSADRSNPNPPPPGMTPPGGAQPGPVGTGPGMPDQMGMPAQSADELIAQLLQGQMSPPTR
jgi:hypothetical protein